MCLRQREYELIEHQLAKSITRRAGGETLASKLYARSSCKLFYINDHTGSDIEERK